MSSNPNLQPVKKRKKHAPDRQQPEWLFPQPEKNPALKPHQEPTLQEKLDKQRSIDFLQRRAMGATTKPAPPVQLLNLIGVFLAEYNFKSTGRLFSAERQGRSKLDGWKDETGGKLEKGMPTLNKIYKEWRKEWDERRDLAMTSSDDDDDAATKRQKMLDKKGKVEKKKLKEEEDVTSSSGTDESGSEESDVDMEPAPVAKRGKNQATSSSSSSATSSESDADDVNGGPAPNIPSSTPIVSTLKRKAAPSRSSESASGTASSSKGDGPDTKKPKMTAELSSESDESSSEEDDEVAKSTPKPIQAIEDNDDSSDSDSDSNSSSASSVKQDAKDLTLPASSDSDSTSDSDSDGSSVVEDKAKQVTNSDTSATMSDGLNKVSPSISSSDASSSESDSEPTPKVHVRKTGRKLSPLPQPGPVPQLPRKNNVPFSRIPRDIKVDDRLSSNKYIPYDYAQRAHEELIVTKGKGFTKEKNKKKRGSYKGGYIDVEGKKGIKFDD